MLTNDIFIHSSLQSLNAAIIAVYPDGRIGFASSDVYDLLKYPPPQLINQNISKILEDPKLDTKSAAEPDKEEFQTFCIDSEGKKISFNITRKRIKNTFSQNLGYVYLFHFNPEFEELQNEIKLKKKQIKEKELKIQELRKEIASEMTSTDEAILNRSHKIEEERVRLIASINNLHFGFLMTDNFQNIILKNKSAQNIFHSLSSKPANIEELEKNEQLSINLSSQIENSIKEKREIHLTSVHTNTNVVNISISPILLGDGNFTQSLGVVILIEDKTEEYKLEVSKEDLFSIASHELRTPLTAIYGYTSLIKQLYFADLKNEDLKNIINNIGLLSKKLALSVNNFLDSSKLEQGKIELKKNRCSLYANIHEAIDETNRLAQEKNLYIKFDPPEAPIMVIADSIRLTQVIINLLSNAIKYTKYGGVSVTAETQADFAKVKIQDTGAGIPQENKKLLFSKFQQVEANLFTRQEGTGLGLYTAKLLVEKMGGEIKLEQTEINKGSTFSFTIPLQNL